jgi:hypothetical protein
VADKDRGVPRYHRCLLEPGDPGDDLSRAWPFGLRHGTVTAFEQPTKITFHQPMAMALHSGTVDVTVRYTLAPRAQSTHVQRVVTLGIPWPLKLLQLLLVPIWRAEQRRTLLALKAYAETLS